MDNKSKFELYLNKALTTHGQLFEETKKNKLIKIIDDLIIVELNINDIFDYKTLFECNNIDYINNIKKLLSKGNKLYEWNRSVGAGEPSQALKHYIEFLEQNSTNIIDIVKTNISKKKAQSLNQILYGPPGTGKTYNTINKAIEIIDNDFYQENKDDRKILKDKFEEYKENGQIEFVTFHQSYGYEEFVEGIKAKTSEKGIEYSVEKGIFKKLCEKAKTPIQKAENILYKVYENINNIYFETRDGKVTAQLNQNMGLKFSNHHGMTKENIIKCLNIFLQASDVSKITQDDLLDIGANGHRYTRYLFTKKIYELYANASYKNYILIIDEINRGNISKIFGELITLIEPSKRIGEEEQILLTLPNSHEPFGVPSNLYIIGTMNTADRSIAQIDTALRRRFEFIEMMPKVELLEDIIIDNINISEMLIAINERIEFIYDREHTIGHSYFMPLFQTPTKNKLDKIFRINIIPLLAEYFYGDWGDIVSILNNNFILEKELKYKPKNQNIQNKVYKINDTFTTEEYQKIYENNDL